MDTFKKYLQRNNKTYFLLTEGPKADIYAARMFFGLSQPHAIVEGPKNGLVGLYLMDKNLFSDKVAQKFNGLNKTAEKLFLKTNVSQIGRRAAEHATVEVIRKESEATDAMKRDEKLAEPLPEKPKEKEEKKKPDVRWYGEDYGWAPLKQFIRDQAVSGKFMNFTKEEEQERVETFKKKYLSMAIDTLKVFKTIFPKESHLGFVDILKNLKIDPVTM
jgi:hypothetical protein